MRKFYVLVELTGGAHTIITQHEENHWRVLQKWNEKRYFSKPLFIWEENTTNVTQVKSREEYYVT